MKKVPTVFVGLSGGVDSSVAAARLLARGFNVVGVFIKVWHPTWLKCNWEQERLDAMRVAAKLDIPFLTCDAESAYHEEVAKYFIAEYKAGRTPNPDVLCNKEVKFGAFLKFALANGADFIATGHYAQNIKVGNHYELHRGVDTHKDQSYFLWTLTQEQLKYVLLPIGDTTKVVIREEARQASLPTSQKKDSQGICFLGHIDIKEFLSHYVDLYPGDVLDEHGKIIGQHEGSIIYTIGQRHGFNVKTTHPENIPHYVIAKDLKRNTITVSTNRPMFETTTKLKISHLNWVVNPPRVNDELSVQIRYRQQPFMMKIVSITETDMTMTAIETMEAYATGQSCVCYQDSLCLGGGIIVQ